MSLAHSDYWMFRALASHAICIGAVHLCSKRAVAERSANLTLTPPSLTKDDKQQKKDAEKEVVQPWRPWYRRVATTSRKALMGLLPLVTIAAAEFFVFWILPKITSQAVISALWALVIGWMLHVPISSNLYFFLGGPLTERLDRAEKTKKAYRKHETANPDAKPFFFVKRNREIVAYLTTACLLAGAYTDNLSVVAMFGAAVMVIHLYTIVSIRQVTASFAILACLGMVAITAIFVPALIGGIAYFGSGNSEEEKSEPSKPKMVIPDWIMPLFTMWNDMITVVPVAFLVMLSLRYDHFGPSATPHLGPSKSAPGDSVIIPRSIPSRSSPTYRLAMGSLASAYILSCLSTGYLHSIGVLKVKGVNVDKPGEELIQCSKIASFVLANLLVPAALCLAMWIKGDWKGWWSYKEDWVVEEVEDDAVEQAEVDDAEKLLFEPAVINSAGNNGAGDKQ